MHGPETGKHHFYRKLSGFYKKYMTGVGLDIGYGGARFDPVLDSAVGVDLDFPDYDGKFLPFSNESQDFVFSSHCLEHIYDPCAAIREWFRVLRLDGHLIVCVPHQYLYEKKIDLPSRYNGDHKRFYRPAELLFEIDLALEPNTWRLIYCKDNDDDFDYSIPPDRHSSGSYEIECVIKKIQKPTWILA